MKIKKILDKLSPLLRDKMVGVITEESLKYLSRWVYLTKNYPIEFDDRNIFELKEMIRDIMHEKFADGIIDLDLSNHDIEEIESSIFRDLSALANKNAIILNSQEVDIIKKHNIHSLYDPSISNKIYRAIKENIHDKSPEYFNFPTLTIYSGLSFIEKYVISTKIDFLQYLGFEHQCSVTKLIEDILNFIGIDITLLIEIFDATNNNIDSFISNLIFTSRDSIYMINDVYTEFSFDLIHDNKDIKNIYDSVNSIISNYIAQIRNIDLIQYIKSSLKDIDLSELISTIIKLDNKILEEELISKDFLEDHGMNLRYSRSQLCKTLAFYRDSESVKHYISSGIHISMERLLAYSVEANNLKMIDFCLSEEILSKNKKKYSKSKHIKYNLGLFGNVEIVQKFLDVKIINDFTFTLAGTLKSDYRLNYNVFNFITKKEFLDMYKNDLQIFELNDDYKEFSTALGIIIYEKLKKLTGDQFKIYTPYLQLEYPDRDILIGAMRDRNIELLDVLLSNELSYFFQDNTPKIETEEYDNSKHVELACVLVDLNSPKIVEKILDLEICTEPELILSMSHGRNKKELVALMLSPKFVSKFWDRYLKFDGIEDILVSYSDIWLIEKYISQNIEEYDPDRSFDLSYESNASIILTFAIDSGNNIIIDYMLNDHNFYRFSDHYTISKKLSTVIAKTLDMNVIKYFSQRYIQIDYKAILQSAISKGNMEVFEYLLTNNTHAHLAKDFSEELGEFGNERIIQFLNENNFIFDPKIIYKKALEVHNQSVIMSIDWFVQYPDTIDIYREYDSLYALGEVHDIGNLE